MGVMASIEAEEDTATSTSSAPVRKRGWWVCRVCMARNPAGAVRCTTPLDVCGKALRDKVLPAEGEMPGKVAMCVGQEPAHGRVALLGVHIESGPRRALFVDIVLWAAFGHRA